jgi:O-antigen/teichoic acid export membrane protein
MTYLDRFIVGGLLTMSAVTYYSTPYDLVTKQGILPVSILGAVFPQLCAFAAIDSGKFFALYKKSLLCIVAVMAPLAILLTIFAGTLLELWLGQAFAEKSSLVVQLLAPGVFINAMAQVPYAAILALGRPDITAKLHVMEFPFYLLLLWGSVTHFGIVGAALAWLIRVMIDAVLLFWIVPRMMPSTCAADASLAGMPACQAEKMATHV